MHFQLLRAAAHTDGFESFVVSFNPLWQGRHNSRDQAVPTEVEQEAEETGGHAQVRKSCSWWPTSAS